MVPGGPPLTETQLPDASDRLRQTGEGADSTLPQIPSEPRSVKQPHRMRMPEVIKQLAQEQPYQPDAADNKKLTEGADRLHDSDSFIPTSTKMVANQLSNQWSNPLHLTAVAVRFLPLARSPTQRSPSAIPTLFWDASW